MSLGITEAPHFSEGEEREERAKIRIEHEKQVRAAEAALRVTAAGLKEEGVTDKAIEEAWNKVRERNESRLDEEALQ